VIVNFFQYDTKAAAAPVSELSPDLQIRCWQPDRQGLPPRGSRRFSNYLWWLLTRTGAFARPDFTEIRIERAGRLLHRLIVTPRWYRFPFMPAGDLQVGDLWTLPEARRQGLAQVAVAEAHRRFGDNDAKFWYVADADNAASTALATSCGYRRIATGRRTRRFGTRVLGQYVIDRYV
jgi:GNAT superfamily N-acetyltransferase